MGKKANGTLTDDIYQQSTCEERFYVGRSGVKPRFRWRAQHPDHYCSAVPVDRLELWVHGQAVFSEIRVDVFSARRGCVTLSVQQFWEGNILWPAAERRSTATSSF